VQAAINRIQPLAMVRDFVETCRELGFGALNFDLIYGLPYQTASSMRSTLEQVVALAPDRIAFYRLALIPEVFKWQRSFRRTDVPEGDLPLELNLLAINRFLDAGYRFIGLDHFAKPDDALSRALDDGSIRRTFQGMTTGGDLSVIGVGPSAISSLETSFAQSVGDVPKWQRAVETGFPVERGLRTSVDDRTRAALLQELYCYRRVRRLDPVLWAPELERLTDLARMGLVEDQAGGGFRLTAPLGELLVRVVAAVFDAYLPPSAYKQGVGRTQASQVG
jgi:oxygen-independent coproporphyrinogen-3 oxidase